MLSVQNFSIEEKVSPDLLSAETSTLENSNEPISNYLARVDKAMGHTFDNIEAL